MLCGRRPTTANALSQKAAKNVVRVPAEQVRIGLLEHLVH
jgi:hypothetical protein